MLSSITSKIILAIILIASGVLIQSCSRTYKPMNLDLTNAKGGGKIKLPDGRAGIQFSASDPNGMAAEWDLPEVVPSGWHTIEIGFYPDSNTRKPVSLEFINSLGKVTLSLDLYQIPFRSGKSTNTLGVYLNHETRAIRWRKNQQRFVASTPLVSLAISRGRPQRRSEVMESIEVSWSNQIASLPDNFGNGLVRSISSEPVSLEWTREGTPTFATPTAMETSVFLSSGLQKLKVKPKIPAIFHLERYEGSPLEVDDTLRKKTLMPLSEESLQIVNITIEGENLAPNETRFADFPGGARTAAVLSWDDGIPYDIRAAQLMEQYGWRGSFFLNQHSSMLRHCQELEAMGHEVASHSLTHPAYWLQSPQRCEDESTLMRKLLEEKVKHPVISFAYPFNYNPAYDNEGDYVVRAQKTAGYLSARTALTGPLNLEDLKEPLKLRTEGKFNMPDDGIEAAWRSAASTKRGVFYLWGHTYEINGEPQWKSLENLLQTYGRRPEVWYASQGDLMIWHWLYSNLKYTATGCSKKITIRLEGPSLHPWWAARVPVALTVPGTITNVQSSKGKVDAIHGGLQVVWP